MDLAIILPALLMGIVEGLTEFLPISSTGHLILLSDLIGFQGPPGKTFEIVIQLGAILAVIVVYWRDLIAMATGFWTPRSRERYAVVNLLLAFIPAMVLGALLRRYVGPHVFVYTLGRGFIVTAVSTFGASLLGEWAGAELPNIEPTLVTTAHWMMAWGEAFMTGMLSAIFVAFRPQWLATWSDNLYLHK